ncbi:MAG: prephenate dehydratase [Actinomycetota bacterium]
MVVDEGVTHLDERQTAQTVGGLVGGDGSRAHTLDQIGQCCLVHLLILPDASRNSSPKTVLGAIALRLMTSTPSPDTSTAPLRVGFLGPLGTFTEQALKSQPDLAVAEHVLYRTMPDVLDAVDAGEVDLGFVAIENSIEGTVNLSQDELVFNHSLLIQREVVLDIEHCLMARPGLAMADVQAVYSQPVATAQCHAFLRNSVGGAPVKATNSTAEAARIVAEEAPAGSAAVAPRASAALYGLEILAADIADHPGNQTRFVVVGREGVPAPTGHDRTAVVVYQRADSPGSLISILQEFAARGINLSNLLSRPTKDGGLGDYCFIIYADGHVADELMADALRSLHSKHGTVKFLGSYPAAGDHSGSVRENADARWREADDWVESLRSAIR